MTLRERGAHGKGAQYFSVVLFGCALVFGLGACREDESGDRVDIAINIPYGAPEAYRYVIVNDEEEEQGEGVLSIVEDRDGNVVYTQQFSDDEGNADSFTVVAQPGTLRPLRGQREIIDADEDRRSVAIARYTLPGEPDPVVRIAELNYDPADEDDPSLRCSPLEIDGEHYYDNNTSLLLWRAITFEEGWSGTYTNVISNRRTQGALTVRVSGQEKVTTPEGEFDAWLVRIEGEGRDSQRAWYATTPDHKLLVYNNNQNQVLLYAGEAEPIEDTEVDELPSECEERD